MKYIIGKKYKLIGWSLFKDEIIIYLGKCKKGYVICLFSKLGPRAIDSSSIKFYSILKPFKGKSFGLYNHNNLKYLCEKCENDKY